MAAAIESRTADAPAWSKTSRIASVDFFDDLGQAETDLARPRKPATFLDAVSAVRFPQSLATAGRTSARAFALSSLLPATANADRCCCFRSRSATHTAFASRASWAASMRPSTWRCGTANFAAERDPRRSRRADFGDTRRDARPMFWRLSSSPCAGSDLPNPMALLPHQASVNDCPLMTIVAGAAAHRADQQFAAPPPQGQGTQAEGAARLSLPPRHRPTPRSSGCSMRFSASSRCGWPNRSCPTCSPKPGVEDFIRNACLAPLTGGGHVIDIHALECDARGHRDLRRRRRRPSLLDDVQHLHHVGEFAPQPGPDPDARHRRPLCRAAAIARSISGSDRTITSGCSARADEPIFDSFIRAKPARQARRGRDVRHQPRQALVKHNPALLQVAQRLRSAFR